VARNRWHVDGEHSHPHQSESPSFYYACIWCNWPSAVTDPMMEIEVRVVPSDYPGGIEGYFRSYQKALSVT